MADSSPTARPGAGNRISRPLLEARQRLFPPLRDSTLSRAADALAENRDDIAHSILANFLEMHPNDPDALNLMADLLRRAGRLEDAERLLSLCMQHSDCPGYRFNYAVVLRELGRIADALAHMETLLKADPGNPLFRDQTAKLLHELGNHTDALVHREQLARFHPAAPEILANYGDSLRMAGDLAQCVATYKRALGQAPRMGAVYGRLANIKGYSFTASDIEWLERMRPLLAALPSQRATLHFVLGNAYADQKLYDKSFENYAQANALQRTATESDPSRFTDYREMCERLFSEAFFRDRAGFGSPARDPIFIVGLPRAGSTLVEQILSTHTQIEGLGELPDLLATVDPLFESSDDAQPLAAYERAVSSLAPDDCRSLARQYLERTAPRRRLGTPFFTDKAGSNFINVGMIHLLFPNAKIVDARRHPLDCGWSCFKSHFPGGQAFSHDLHDIGRHYSDYVRLMAHFDRVLPGRVYRVIYEELVSDPEVQIRRLFDYLAIPFEESSLRSHENRRIVKTLSGEQVRAPIYKSGIAQWIPYERWLDPLKFSLGPVLNAYPGTPQ